MLEDARKLAGRTVLNGLPQLWTLRAVLPTRQAQGAHKHNSGVAAKRITSHFLVVFEAPVPGGNSRLVQQEWLKAVARGIIGPRENDTALKTMCVHVCMRTCVLCDIYIYIYRSACPTGGGQSTTL